MSVTLWRTDKLSKTAKQWLKPAHALRTNAATFPAPATALIRSHGTVAPRCPHLNSPALPKWPAHACESPNRMAALWQKLVLMSLWL